MLTVKTLPLQITGSLVPIKSPKLCAFLNIPIFVKCCGYISWFALGFHDDWRMQSISDLWWRGVGKPSCHSDICSASVPSPPILLNKGQVKRLILLQATTFTVLLQFFLNLLCQTLACSGGCSWSPIRLSSSHFLLLINMFTHCGCQACMLLTHLGTNMRRPFEKCTNTHMITILDILRKFTVILLMQEN